jgi:hypothetical protein
MNGTGESLRPYTVRFRAAAVAAAKNPQDPAYLLELHRLMQKGLGLFGQEVLEQGKLIPQMSPLELGQWLRMVGQCLRAQANRTPASAQAESDDYLEAARSLETLAALLQP